MTDNIIIGNRIGMLKKKTEDEITYFNYKLKRLSLRASCIKRSLSSYVPLYAQEKKNWNFLLLIEASSKST